MRISSLERKILWAAIEDFAGLWELVWELASTCPEIPDRERRAVAERAVRDLLEHECIELYERNGISGRERRVPADRWNVILGDDTNWREPTKGTNEVLVGATRVGEEVYAAEVGD